MEENKTAPTPPPETIPGPQSRNPSDPPAKKKSKFLIILVGLGIAAALLIGGFFLYQVLFPEKEVDTSLIKPATFSANKATDGAKVDETADWKTYISSKRGYSIKFPETWIDQSCEDSEILFLGPSQNVVGVCQSEFGGLINVSYTPDFQYEDYIAQQPFVDLSLLDNAKRENTFVANQSAVRISGTYNDHVGTMSKGGQKTLYLVDYKGGVLSINYYSEPDWGDYSKSFEQIVSTLELP